MSAPVLLVHGFATNAARTWGSNGWIDILGESGRSVIAPDLLGHGDAPKPHDPAAYDDMHTRLLEVMPDEPVDAIGFSLGSRMLLTLAGEHPERFNRIVATAVGESLLRKEDINPVANALLGDEDGGDNPFLTYFRHLGNAPGVDPKALVAVMRRSTNVPLTDEQLARVTCPVLVVLGDQDFAGPADPLVDRLPDATSAVLRGVDHFSTPKSFELMDVALAFLGADTP